MNLYEVRQQYGGVYVTVFPDGLTVPWKPLPLNEYIQYIYEYQRAIIPPAILEDEIFKKCVVDQTTIRHMPFLKAGIVTTVVRNIWEHSGPSNIDELNNDINRARAQLVAPDVKLFHELVMFVLNVFPYKPEEVYAMDYDTFMSRVVMAERKLLEAGAMKQPLIFENLEEKKQRRKRVEQHAKDAAEQMPKKVDARALWNEQQQQKRVSKKARVAAEKLPDGPVGEDYNNVDRKKWWNVSPVLEVPQPTHDINFRTEAAEQRAFVLTGHEKMDEHLEHAKMLEDAKIIYKDLIEEFKKRKNSDK